MIDDNNGMTDEVIDDKSDLFRAQRGPGSNKQIGGVSFCTEFWRVSFRPR